MAVDSYVSSNSIQLDEVENQAEMNVLQKHVMFFDRNKDGIIHPWETFQGFQAIGCGMFLSWAAAIFIHVGFSRKTRPGKGFSPLFPIEIGNIQMAKHGSDSGVYDSEGRFDELKFEEIFSKHARTHPHALTSGELSEMLRANRDPKDYAGRIAAYVEWKVLYYLCKDQHGLLRRNTIKASYDGSLFEQMAHKDLRS